MNTKDKQIVRDLAKRYMEIACSDEQKRANARMLATNDLQIVRPPVLIDEIPWEQMDIDGELTCLCEDARAREAEAYFRQHLYRKKYFRADMIADPFWKVTMAYDVTPLGLEEKAKLLEQSDATYIQSHGYEDILEDESALDLIKDPVCTLRPDLDEERMNYFTDLFGDAIPVKLKGRGYLYSSPWDEISQLRGVQPIYDDMYDRPEYLHSIIQKFVARTEAIMNFVEVHSHVDPEATRLHCTPAAVSGFAQDGWKATWYRGMSQPFSCVSPAMFKEFELDYIKPLAERFGYTYYGCCEPLDNKISMLKSIKNLRKLGVSPWANVESCAEQIGGDYVYSRKPNPANVAVKTDPEVIRRETEDTVRACLKNGCPCEFILKDISTVSNRPENLIVWAETVSEVLDQYYK